MYRFKLKVGANGLDSADSKRRSVGGGRHQQNYAEIQLSFCTEL